MASRYAFALYLVYQVDEYCRFFFLFFFPFSLSRSQIESSACEKEEADVHVER